ncbi:hypothetical protein PUN28_013047 [Cardiocondyla obscurior]|uniref:Uncharacterized protein n=1 Tax=Cardiocondyla obscurior TaxID=286306 RepID=A0AAW2FAP1_9HYME
MKVEINFQPLGERKKERASARYEARGRKKGKKREKKKEKPSSRPAESGNHVSRRKRRHGWGFVTSSSRLLSSLTSWATRCGACWDPRRGPTRFTRRRSQYLATVIIRDYQYEAFNMYQCRIV